MRTGLDWMTFYDVINREIHQTQNYTMMAYIPYTFVAMHFQFAAVLAQKIQYPTAQADVMAVSIDSSRFRFSGTIIINHFPVFI